MALASVRSVSELSRGRIPNDKGDWKAAYAGEEIPLDQKICSKDSERSKESTQQKQVRL